MSHRRQWLIVLTVLPVLAAVVGREVFACLIAPAAPLNFDEAAHSLPAFYLLRDIRNLDLRAFWGDFHIQTLWPPMFSILQAPFLAAFGRSDESARIFAYVMLVATLLLACVLAQQIDRALAPPAALIAGLIALSAPGWLFVSSWAMQETPVAFMTFLAFGAFLRALSSGRAAWYAATGIALFLLFLTKYNYAAFALAAVGSVDLAMRWKARVLSPESRVLSPQFRVVSSESRVPSVALAGSTRAVRSRLGTRDSRLATFFALYAPFALGLLAWFFTDTAGVSAFNTVKWRDFAFFVSNEDSGYVFWSAQNLLYYVRAAGDWLMPHWLVLVAALLASGYALRRVRHPGVVLLAIFFGLGFVLATAHQLKSQRYITPIFPSLWLLAGLGLAAWARDRARMRLVLVGALAVALGSWSFWLPRLQPVWAGHPADDMRAATNQIVRWQDGAKPVLIIGTFGELSPPLFEWRLRPLPAFANNPAVQYDAPPRDAKDDIERVQLWLDENPGAQVTLIDVDESSPLFNTADMQTKNAWKQRIVARFGEVRGYRKIDERQYPDSGLTISFWQRNEP